MFLWVNVWRDGLALAVACSSKILTGMHGLLLGSHRHRACPRVQAITQHSQNNYSSSLIHASIHVPDTSFTNILIQSSVQGRAKIQMGNQREIGFKPPNSLHHQNHESSSCIRHPCWYTQLKPPGTDLIGDSGSEWNASSLSSFFCSVDCLG